VFEWIPVCVHVFFFLSEFLFWFRWMLVFSGRNYGVVFSLNGFLNFSPGIFCFFFVEWIIVFLLIGSTAF